MKGSFSGKSFCDLQMDKETPNMIGFSLLRKMSKFRDFQKSTRRLIYLCVSFIVLCNSWDTELNPGLHPLLLLLLLLFFFCFFFCFLFFFFVLFFSHFPCGVCEASVGWDDRALVCDSCNVWYHTDCQGMDSTMFEFYNQTLDRSLAWECLKRGMPNFSTSLFDTIGLIDTSNRFDSLSIPDSRAPTDIGPPTATSFPSWYTVY